ncbi:hypothetical protein [Sporosarcina thermotolerans]|uniref:hypothetical protein n=1 Tax=Sporosarcina thermotolerans TaxID=633404 RepID=UPI003D2F6EC1
MQIVLRYKEWRNFIKVIEKAKSACKTSGNGVLDQLVDVNKMVRLGEPGTLSLRVGSTSFTPDFMTNAVIQ